MPCAAFRSCSIPFGNRLATLKTRVMTYAEGNSKPFSVQDFDMNENAQIAHANIAIATSNVIGKFPGNSVERDFLSQAFSDFIYAIIIEAMGIFGGASERVRLPIVASAIFLPFWFWAFPC